jgi:DNA polymerase-3 subunit beta
MSTIEVMKRKKPMKIEISPSKLLSAIKVPVELVKNSGRSVMPILECILISATESDISISATNLETSITTSIEISDVSIDRKGALVVDAKRFSDIVRNLKRSDSIVLDFIVGKMQLVLSAGMDSFRLPCFSASDWPKVDKMDDANDLISGSVDPEIILGLINKTSFCTLDDSSRPQLCGVCFLYNDGKLVAMANDTRRAVWTAADCENLECLNTGVIIPKNALSVVYDVCKLSSSDIQLGFYEGAHILFIKSSFEGGRMMVSVRLVKKDFPDLRGKISTNDLIMIEMSSTSVMDALKKAKLVMAPGDGVNIGPAGDSDDFFISVVVDNITGYASVSVSGEVIMGNVDEMQSFYMFNPDCLIDYLKVISGSVVLGLSGDNLNPIHIRDASDEGFFGILMPMDPNKRS